MGCKDIGIKKSEFVAKTHSLIFLFIFLYEEELYDLTAASTDDILIEQQFASFPFAVGQLSKH